MKWSSKYKVGDVVTNGKENNGAYAKARSSNTTWTWNLDQEIILVIKEIHLFKRAYTVYIEKHPQTTNAIVRVPFYQVDKNYKLKTLSSILNHL